MSGAPTNQGSLTLPGRGLARPRLSSRMPAAAALPTLLLLVILATLAGYNRPLAVRVAPTDETRQLFYGFHGLERTDDGPFRWTDGWARICLDQLGGVPNATLRVRILGAGAHALGRQQVAFLANDQLIVMAPIQGATRVYQMHLGDALRAADDDCIAIVSAAGPTEGDVRPLGVPFAGMALDQVVTAGINRPALLQLGLNMALAAFAYWLLVLGGISAWVAVGGVLAVAALLLAAITGGQTAPGLGLARHMLPLVTGMAAVGVGALLMREARQLPVGRSRLARDLLAMAFWSVALVGVTDVLQLLLGFGGVWPLKAGFFPSLTPAAALPAALFAGWAWLVLRLLARPGAGGLGAGAALLLLGALLLPVTLKAGVRGWESLFTTYTNNPYEYIADVPKVGGDPAGFLRGFVANKEQLALHSSTHPPGAILMLWGVERLLGPGPVAASWTTIGLSALAVLAALWVGLRLGGPRLGLLAGAMAAVMPGQLIYSTTSLDGVFNMLLALGAAAFLLALERPLRPGLAALAGALIALGLFFTYAATQLFFFGVAVAAVGAWRAWPGAPGRGAGRLWAAGWPLARQGAIAAAVIVGLYLALFAATGFNVVEGALRATAINVEVMRNVTARPFLPPSLAYYTLYLVANLLAFAWYLGPWGLAAAGSAGRAALAEDSPGAFAALAVGLAALVAGMALSGLFNREVERIWGFTYPLLAVLVARHALQGDKRAQGWRAGLFLALLFAHGMAIRLLLNTFW